jgi:micrococcal nuclease
VRRRLLLAATLALCLGASCGGEHLEGKVVAVHDGDTVTVLRGGEQVKLRLACIDAPERGQAFGSRSRDLLAELVMGRAVTLEVIDRDQYGRTVARLHVDGNDVNLAMVRAGLAWHYRYHCPDDAALAAAEAEAREARRGLWADAHPEAPWEWRRHR